MRAGYPPPLVAAAVDRLLASGYLDDLAFARTWVASRDRARPRGAIALRRELRLRGVAEAIIEAVLAEREEGAPDAGGTVPHLRSEGGSGAGGLPIPSGTSSSGADEAAARRLLDRRAAALARIADPRRRRASAYALLVRAGFEPDLAAELARAVGESAGDDEGTEAG